MQLCDNIDEYIINQRQILYDKSRKDTFIKMCKKHQSQQCNCSKKKKICNCIGSIDLSKLNDTKYISNLYDNGVLDSLYNIMQSITQSLRPTTGTNFENIIEDTFIRGNIKYNKQIKLSNGHIIDFAIPPYDSNIPIKDYTGTIISCKTTLRERYLQDKYLSCKVITITTDQNKKENCICINKEKKLYTKWFNSLICNKNKMKVIDLFCG